MTLFIRSCEDNFRNRKQDLKIEAVLTTADDKAVARLTILYADEGMTITTKVLDPVAAYQYPIMCEAHLAMCILKTLHEATTARDLAFSPKITEPLPLII
ncbi:hypothetical protein [Shinella zoogloeoides]|uniref:hypothetical protein n=1 Tax=Shinella zoogloeoides TaxID=352475 RepID=UPI00273F08E8|nr:hypothetical protein [Shinella zoogloeoides]WLR90967.1 hypothetical protein Q9316_00015 [Shinella zoogloeoides]